MNVPRRIIGLKGFSNPLVLVKFVGTQGNVVMCILLNYLQLKRRQKNKRSNRISNATHDWEDEYDQRIEDAVAFGKQYKNVRDRLAAIMKNIIKNDGVFIPAIRIPATCVLQKD